MITVTQTVVGAAQFTGAGVLGFVDFATILPLPPSSDQDLIPIVDNVALNGNGVATMDINCFLARDLTTVPTERLIILNTTAVTGFSNLGCKLGVPKLLTPNTFTPWKLFLITVGKTVTASLIVSCHLGRMSELT